jgi:NAD(P)-dependent dehydrogenase (short-subunit alcohol dehydrogenase family)
MRILVTGAGRAIGAATCSELAAAGHEVIATARDPSLLGGLDVTDGDSIRRALEHSGELDAIVNNAAVSGKGPLEDYPVHRLRAMFETNAIGPLVLLQQVLPEWRARGHGVVVNVSSVQGRVATPLEGPYSASKSALESLSETLHYELGHFGIRVVIIEPGYIARGGREPTWWPRPSVVPSRTRPRRSASRSAMTRSPSSGPGPSSTMPPSSRPCGRPSG